MSRSLDDLRPEFRSLVDPWLAACTAAGLDILVTCTLRSNDEQTALYAIGRTIPGTKKTNARAGESAHNFGLALDFVPMIHGKPQWQNGAPEWMEAIQLAEAQGMESLAKSQFPELAHLQLPNWKLLTGENNAQ